MKTPIAIRKPAHVCGMAGETGTDTRPGQALDPALADLIDPARPKPDEYLVCAHCKTSISHTDYATLTNGSFEHYCTNPHGFDFHIGCYRRAPGCAISGEPTHADSWFPGFMWQLASCSNCTTHLGWLFERPDEHFYGLILDRIEES
ncbi:MAG: cereblon family protein [Pseudomonadaceae bacterium]|nr:cereblon family protein [Pseudomonadaceae bacterium]